MNQRARVAIDYESYRLELRDKRDRVLENLGERYEMLAGMGHVAEDDRAQISHDEFISLERTSRDYRQLRLLDEALSRLDSGIYGSCQNCGQRIAMKRLRALPWARYCMGCQDKGAEGAGLD
jgi:DnaK suppressor protein